MVDVNGFGKVGVLLHPHLRTWEGLQDWAHIGTQLQGVKIHFKILIQELQLGRDMLKYAKSGLHKRNRGRGWLSVCGCGLVDGRGLVDGCGLVDGRGLVCG